MRMNRVRESVLAQVIDLLTMREAKYMDKVLNTKDLTDEEVAGLQYAGEALRKAQEEILLVLSSGAMVTPSDTKPDKQRDTNLKEMLYV